MRTRPLVTHYFLSQNGGTNCPACRSISTNVSSSRVLQVMIDVLLRADPSRARTDREKQQADEVYKPGLSFRVRI
jgi:E3 ubiquitin-protein ligase CHFR